MAKSKRVFTPKYDNEVVLPVLSRHSKKGKAKVLKTNVS